MQQLTLAIDDMHCGMCVKHVETALGELAGVQTDQVSIGNASVTYDPGQITPQTITLAVTAAGYPARVA